MKLIFNAFEIHRLLEKAEETLVEYYNEGLFNLHDELLKVISDLEYADKVGVDSVILETHEVSMITKGLDKL